MSTQMPHPDHYHDAFDWYADFQEWADRELPDTAPESYAEFVAEIVRKAEDDERHDGLPLTLIDAAAQFAVLDKMATAFMDMLTSAMRPTEGGGDDGDR